MTSVDGVVLAHQGGWDEILLFVVPVLLAVWAVRRMERRHRDSADTRDDTTHDSEVPGGD